MQVKPCKHAGTHALWSLYPDISIKTFHPKSYEHPFNARQISQHAQKSRDECDLFDRVSSDIQCTVSAKIDLSLNEFTILYVKKLSHSECHGYAFVEMKSVSRKLLIVMVWSYP